MLFEKIQQKIWGLSVSAGSSPYTLLSFNLDEGLRKSTLANRFAEFDLQSFIRFITILCDPAGIRT